MTLGVLCASLPLIFVPPKSNELAPWYPILHEEMLADYPKSQATKSEQELVVGHSNQFQTFGFCFCCFLLLP